MKIKNPFKKRDKEEQPQFNYCCATCKKKYNSIINASMCCQENTNANDELAQIIGYDIFGNFQIEMKKNTGIN